MLLDTFLRENIQCISPSIQAFALGQLVGRIGDEGKSVKEAFDRPGSMEP